jgi:hypothetical protein
MPNNKNHEDKKHNNQIEVIDEVTANVEDMVLNDPESCQSPRNVDGESGEVDFDLTVVGNSVNVGRHSLLLNALLESGSVQDVSHTIGDELIATPSVVKNETSDIPRFMDSTKSSMPKVNMKEKGNETKSTGPVKLEVTKPVPFKFHASKERSQAADNKVMAKKDGKSKATAMKVFNSAPFKVTLSEKKPTIPHVSLSISS